MTGLTGDLDDGRALREEKRAEEVPEVIRPRAVEPRGFGRRREDPSAPVPVGRVAPRLTIPAREDERARVRPATCQPPLSQVGRQRGQQPNGTGLARLRWLHFAKRDTPLAEDRPPSPMPPLHGECFAWTQASVGEDADERGIS